MESDFRRPDLLVVDGIFDKRAQATISERVALAEFGVQELGPRRMGRARERAVIEDPVLAQTLWEALGPLVAPIRRWFPNPPTYLRPPVTAWEASGCNPRSRLYRYSLGGDFSMHRDEPWRPDERTRSMLTVLVYLPTGGEPCVGGETVVDGEAVHVRDWRVAVFDHRIPHEGRPVESGRKLVLRNDIVATAVT